MELCVKTNGYKIISSGSVLLYDQQSTLTMDIKTDSSFEFSIEISFSDTLDKKTQIIQSSENSTIKLACSNFNPAGTGTVRPLSIATISGKEWFIHFYAYIMGERGPRKVEYSILEKE